MVPYWMFWVVSLLLIVCIAGWSFTINRSVARCMHMYDEGRKRGREEEVEEARQRAFKREAKARARRRF